MVERRRGDYPRSVELYRRALDISLPRLGESSPVVARTLVALGAALIYVDSIEAADAPFRRAVAATAVTADRATAEGAAEART